MKSFENTYISKKRYRLDFGLSSNPLGTSSFVSKNLSTQLTSLESYPEVGYPALVNQLADFYRVPTEYVLLGTGLDGVIFDLMNFLMKDGNELVLSKVTFQNAVVPAKMRGAKILQIPMKEDLRVDFDSLIAAATPKTKCIFLCNPNNPTGIYEPLDSIENLLSRTHTFVIVDEANIEYCGGSSLGLIHKYPHLIVLRTFSKAYGLAGMRVGYAISSSAKFLLQVSQSRPPFFLSCLSERAALLALKDPEHINKTASYLAEERAFLTKELESMGFELTPSVSNTLLCKVPKINASSLLDQLHKFDCHAINGTHFNLEEDQYLRIAPRMRIANEELIFLLRRLLK
jgi:histidinol-phosphate aminotransferase